MINQQPTRWRLDNRRALITGATKGIGLAIAHELLALGARVTIVARDSEMVAEKIADWKTQNLPAHGVAADISTPEGREAVRSYLGETGLDILVNNVGTNIRKTSDEYTPEEFAHIFNTNLATAWEMSRAFHEPLAESGEGCIVNIGSVAGSFNVGSGAPYAMTKAALDQLTRYLAVEWAKDNIRVNAVNPWYTRTPLAFNLLANPAFAERVLAATPLNRLAESEDVSGLVTFLCLPAARHITGQTIAVDGGFSALGM